MQKIRSHGGKSQIELLIIPCDCQTYPGRLVASASQVLGKRVEVRVASAPLHQGDIASVDRVIAVDGCEEQCVKKTLDKRDVECEFYLRLDDLGIEDAGAGEVTDDDLQLAVDGIVACAARVSGCCPKLPGCC